MSFYPVSSLAAIGSAVLPGPGDAAAVMVVVPVSVLAWPVGEGSGKGARSGLVVSGAEKIRSGESVAWCEVVAVAPAVVRRDGRVRAGGRPCGHARLSGLEQELDARCGEGTIEAIAAGVRPAGKIKGKVAREMSVEFTIRAVLLLTLMPGADHHEVLSVLLGDLLGVPWQRAHAVPSGTVLSTWRAAVGAAALQELQRLVLQAVVAEDHDDGHEQPPVQVGGGLRLASIDGTVTAMPDSKGQPSTVRHCGTRGRRLRADP